MFRTYYLHNEIPTDLKDKFHTTWQKRSLKCADINNAKLVTEGLLGKIALSFALLCSFQKDSESFKLYPIVKHLNNLFGV